MVPTDGLMLHVIVPGNPVPVNCCVPPMGTLTADGLTEAVLNGVGVGVGVPELPPPQPTMQASTANASRIPDSFDI